MDYWDYLGHPDPYADPIFTDRQTEYAIADMAEYLFTPQLMVNTKTLTSLGQLDGNIATSLGTQVPASVTLWQDTEAPELVIHYKVKDAPADAMLHLVMVEGGIANPVSKGENAGKTLEHEAAARWYATVAPERNWITVTHAEDVVVENARFIGFLQSPGTMQLHGAAQIETLERP